MKALTNSEKNEFIRHFESRTIRKKTNLLQAGKTAKEVYFLKKGCIRLYYEKDGADISAYFFTENMFAGAYDSFISQKPSRHFIETTEDCEVLAISYKKFQTLLKDNPKMNELVRTILRVTYRQDKIDVFNRAYPITKSEDLLYVPTPGHTHGHSSVIFKTDEFDILFAGDTSYDQEQILVNELAGVNADYKTTLQTYKNILDYGNIRKTIYLPTHDENAGQRLRQKSFIV